MRPIFVAGTDTGVGKTVVTGCLAKYLSEKGYSVITQKWIQTGAGSILSSDIKTHLKFMGRSLNSIKEYIPYVAPYIFKAACSPHLASRIEKERINEGTIIKSFNSLSRDFDFVIAEGIGGALVPFDNKRLVIDILKKLGPAVLVVAENRLGAINHTLLTIEALVSRKIDILGVIFNNIKEENKLVLKDNPRIINALIRQKVFGVLPRGNSYQEIYEEFSPIGKRILEALE